MKPLLPGNIWIARATLFNSAGKKIGTCTDTPNAIAKAFMEIHQATSVKEYLSDIAKDRTDYINKIQPWNTCPSGYKSLNRKNVMLVRNVMSDRNRKLQEQGIPKPGSLIQQTPEERRIKYHLARKAGISSVKARGLRELWSTHFFPQIKRHLPSKQDRKAMGILHNPKFDSTGTKIYCEICHKYILIGKMEKHLYIHKYTHTHDTKSHSHRYSKIHDHKNPEAAWHLNEARKSELTAQKYHEQDDLNMWRRMSGNAGAHRESYIKSHEIGLKNPISGSSKGLGILIVPLFIGILLWLNNKKG